MKRLGIVVDNLGVSQLSYNIIKNINGYLKDNKNQADPIVFYETLQFPCLTPLFSTMCAVEVWGYDAPLIATSINTAYKILKVPHDNNSKIYLYAWDLEWLRLPRYQSEYYGGIYSSLPIIARSEEHAAILKNNWNASVVDINENFDFKKMVELK